MIVELLQPAGPDLARRWLAALLLVDRAEREALVESIERQVVEVYAPAAPQVGGQTHRPPLISAKESQHAARTAHGGARPGLAAVNRGGITKRSAG